MVTALLISLALSIQDTLQLNESCVTALKETLPLNKLAAASTSIRAEELKSTDSYRPQKLSGLVPGLHIPDYGASLTSTIYIRGLGSRMENPVLGLYVDGIPVLDKNAYDMDWEAVQNATLLRGPQGTLYGRNAMGGVLAVRTLSPSDGSAASAHLEYGTANTFRAGASAILGNHVLSATYRHSDGFYLNQYKGRNCDPYDGLQARWKWESPQGERLFLSNVLTMGLSSEGGFAYGLYRDGVQYPVSYNDEGSYKRLSLMEGFRLRYRGDQYSLDGTASLQLLSDDMHMDQDYTEHSVFTLQQQQQSGALTAELILRRNHGDWSTATGAFCFGKLNHLWAPVVFKREGIQTLILDNANRNIPEEIGYLDIPDETMPIGSDFLIGSWNAALFHESVYRTGAWTLTAGLRLDYEGARMDYDCNAQLHYRFVPTMQADKPFTVPYRGHTTHGRVVLLPKLSALYEVSEQVKLFSTVGKGYRAGGFNTQIFSDILQNQTMTALMKDLGVYLDRPAVSVNAGNTEYAPEEAWNFEAGVRLRKGGFRADVSLYALLVKNQQLTVFPPGMSTGRMMANAARGRSLGAEAEASWQSGGWRLHAAWSFCDARFVNYNDGNNDYSGKRIPYIPAHTLFASAGYHWKHLQLDATLRGSGPFAWNEDNSLEEPFTLLPGARAALVFDKWEWFLRGENLGDTPTRVFYFRSMGNDFFAKGKPRLLMTGIIIHLTNL